MKQISSAARTHLRSKGSLAQRFGRDAHIVGSSRTDMWLETVIKPFVLEQTTSANSSPPRTLRLWRPRATRALANANPLRIMSREFAYESDDVRALPGFILIEQLFFGEINARVRTGTRWTGTRCFSTRLNETVLNMFCESKLAHAGDLCTRMIKTLFRFDQMHDVVVLICFWRTFSSPFD